jgi:hypothetical protein
MALIGKFQSYEDMKKATRLALFERFYEDNKYSMEKNGGIKYEKLEKFFLETGYTIIKDSTQKKKIEKDFFDNPENNKIINEYLKENKRKFNLNFTVDGELMELQKGKALEKETIDKIEKEVEERHKKVPKFFQKILGTDAKIKAEQEKAINEESEKNGANAFMKKLALDMANETAGYVNEIIQDPNNEYVSFDEMKAIREFFVEEAKSVNFDKSNILKNMNKTEQEKIKEKELENARFDSESEFNLKNEFGANNFREAKIPNKDLEKASALIAGVKEKYNIKEKVVAKLENVVEKENFAPNDKVITDIMNDLKTDMKDNMKEFNQIFSNKNDKEEPIQEKSETKANKKKEYEFER